MIKRTQEIDDETLFHSDTFLGDEFSDEMYHWKYIKREKKNGKWVYYYDTSELDKFNKGETVETEKTDSSGRRIHTSTKYEKSDKLFDRKSNYEIKTNGSTHSNTTKTQGKLSRSYAKAEKKIYDTFYNSERKTERVHSLKKKAAKAKSKVKSWLRIK